MENNKKKTILEKFHEEQITQLVKDLSIENFANKKEDISQEKSSSHEFETKKIDSDQLKTIVESGAAQIINDQSFTNPSSSYLKPQETTEVVKKKKDEHNIRVKEKHSNINEKEQEHIGGVVFNIDNDIQFAYHLKLAQQKILDLEKEIDRIREENELLTIAAQSQKKHAEEYFNKFLMLEKEHKEALEQVQMEMSIYRQNLKQKDQENKHLLNEITQLKSEIHRQIHTVRKRERDLENRLELVRQERNALLKSKDDIILQLRQKIDDLNSEIEILKDQNQTLNKKIEEQQNQLARTIKTLRLVLNHLESDEELENFPLKKAK